MVYVFFLLVLLTIIALVVGLIRPKSVILWGTNEKKTRKRVLLYYGLAVLVFFIAFVATVPALSPEEKVAMAMKREEEQSKKEVEKKAKAEEKAKKEAEDKEKIESAEKAKAEEKAKKEAEAKAQAEEKAKLEAEAKAKTEAEAKAKAEQLAREEAERKAKAAEQAGLDEEQFKSSSQKVGYKDMARNPDDYKSKKVVFTGKVIQTLESGNNVSVRVNVTQNQFGWDDTIYVNYTKKAGESRILEDDVIRLWGTVKGLKTYQSVMGGQITIPEVDAKYISLIK